MSMQTARQQTNIETQSCPFRPKLFTVTSATFSEFFTERRSFFNDSKAATGLPTVKAAAVFVVAVVFSVSVTVG